MKSITESIKEFKSKKVSEKKNEEVDVDGVIKELVDAKPSDDNAEQGKFVSLMKGLAFSDDPKATEFMSKVMDKIDGSLVDDKEVSEGLSGAEIESIVKKATFSEILDMLANEAKGKIADKLYAFSEEIAKLEK